MGIMAGATSGKFVLAAAALIFQARVDDHPVRAALIPGAPITRISPHLDAQLHAHGGTEARHKIGIRAMHVFRSLAVVDPDPIAELELGQDALSATPIAIDFRNRTLALLLDSEAAAEVRHDHAIALDPAGPGRWKIAVETPGMGLVVADLDLTRADSICAGSEPACPGPPTSRRVNLGGVWLDRVDVRESNKGPVVVGLGAFAGLRVIFDLAHNRIWVGA